MRVNNKESQEGSTSNRVVKLHPFAVTGLTEAEGSFSVSVLIRKGRALGFEIRPRFLIHMHIREVDLLPPFFNIKKGIVLKISLVLVI